MALGLNGNVYGVSTPGGFQERSTVQAPPLFGGGDVNLPEYAGLEQALMGQSQRAFTDPGGTLDMLRQQFSASGLGNSGVLLGAQQRADTQRQGGLAEQLAQLRVQRAMAQLEQRRFADQLGFQDYQGNLNRGFQAQQGDLAFQRQQQMIQQQRDYEQSQQSNNLIGSLISGGLGFLTGGVGGLLSGGLLGGNAASRFFQGGFAGPGALAGAGLQRGQIDSLIKTYPDLYNNATTPRYPANSYRTALDLFGVK